MIMIRALAAAAAAQAYVVLLLSASASSASAYSYYCNRQQCCWALRVNHWDFRNICYGCDGQDVCNVMVDPPRRRPTFRPTRKPTNKPTNARNVWRNDGWRKDGWRNDGWKSGVQTNYCCQTTGNCPIDTPFVTHRQWLDRSNRVRLTYCCQKMSQSSWQGDNWGGDRQHNRSLQSLLPICVNTDMPTQSPTESPTQS
eukprot:CAMPEP_0113436320 /NCGR_PEP_ID=MMETSP0013_2-20120614/36787_1 /TAXON_ID=2843 ORGANISM="Skeletonema costatum, Strain 1716" /NCGR_SAMPLE_ID=MMETSP0013_2 /ASSEMBLY_ACC=CAM_ASM_000158 /LENGTH=197 /DNA_ID=CAMNT_0000326835 /DNA_START=58 /DNA_END=648 /DNA_ORIENTATION=- /assembly_acc=CAM_ASM_000158